MAEEANYCEEARDAIDKILRQSNISYEVNTGKLDNYTQAVFDQHHQDQHSMWRTTQYEGLFPNRESLPFEDYDKEIPEHLLHHIKFEKDVVSHELTNLYHRLKFLDKAFRAVREDHERHKHMLMNRYPGERYSHMVDFFNTQYSYIVALLRETESGMEALNIARPVVVDDMLQPFDGVMELRDWLVTREHLKLLNYVIRAYNVLLKGCS